MRFNNFCMLILYSITLMKVIVSSISFLVKFLWYIYFNFFLILFILFSSLIALAKNSSPIWRKNGSSGHPCCVSDFRKILRIFYHLLLRLTSVVLESVPSTPGLFMAFIMKRCWIFSRHFLYLLR